MTKNVRARRGGMVILLLGVVLLFLGGVRPAHAQSANCVADFGGVVDGNAHPTPPGLLRVTMSRIREMFNVAATREARAGAASSCRDHTPAEYVTKIH